MDHFNPGRLVTANPKFAKDLLENNFFDEKRTRIIALKGELRVIQIVDRTVDTYFQKIESNAALLNALGSPLSNDDIVTHATNGLSDKFAHVVGIIAHRNPFPDLATVRPMVKTEEMRLNAKKQVLPSDTTSSAPTVLLAENSNSRDNHSRHTRHKGFL